MRTRIKFMLLFFFSFGSFTTIFMLFLRSDYARSERAYFYNYPYREKAARHDIKPKEIVKTEMPVSAHKKIYPEPETAALARLVPNAGPARKPPHKPSLQKSPIQKRHVKPPPVKIRPSPREIIIPDSPPPPPEKKQTAAENPRAPGWEHHANMGYLALRNGDDKEAIVHFMRALEMAPDMRDIHLQLAYIHKKLGQNPQAAAYFKSAIDLTGHTGGSFAYRREVEQLQRRFEVNGYVIYRDESSTTRQLGADLTRSQAGFEAAYQPVNRNGRKFQIYARLLSAMKQDRLEFEVDSVQAGLGLRLKPLSGHNLVLSAERLVKVGIFARNDWMIRAGYSRDYGTDYRADKPAWWSYSLYLDAALIDPGSPDIFLTGQAIGGYNLALGRGLVLQPRVTSLVSWQKDSFRKATLFEAGPGVNLRLYFNDGKYEAYRAYIDLTLEYRTKISGNSIGGSGPVIGLSMHF